MKLYSLEIIKDFKQILKRAKNGHPEYPAITYHLKTMKTVLGRAPKFILPPFKDQPIKIGKIDFIKLPYEELVIEHDIYLPDGITRGVSAIWPEGDWLLGLSISKGRVGGNDIPWTTQIQEFKIHRETNEVVFLYDLDTEEKVFSTLCFSRLATLLDEERVTIERPTVAKIKARQLNLSERALDYRVLDIDPNKPLIKRRVDEEKTADDTPLKAEHERRGHWRTLHKSGKRVWVKACTINKGKTDRRVIKDYQLKDRLH